MPFYANAHFTVKVLRATKTRHLGAEQKAVGKRRKWQNRRPIPIVAVAAAAAAVQRICAIVSKLIAFDRAKEKLSLRFWFVLHQTGGRNWQDILYQTLPCHLMWVVTWWYGTSGISIDGHAFSYPCSADYGAVFTSLKIILSMLSANARVELSFSRDVEWQFPKKVWWKTLPV